MSKQFTITSFTVQLAPIPKLEHVSDAGLLYGGVKLSSTLCGLGTQVS